MIPHTATELSNENESTVKTIWPNSFHEGNVILGSLFPILKCISPSIMKRTAVVQKMIILGHHRFNCFIIFGVGYISFFKKKKVTSNRNNFNRIFLFLYIFIKSLCVASPEPPATLK